MIKIKNLTDKDKGRWVIYGVDNQYCVHEEGKILCWNSSTIFVVFKCNGEWSKWEEYTAEGCCPEDLTFKEIDNANNIHEV